MNREQRRNPSNGIQFPPGAFPNAGQMQAAAPPMPTFKVGPLMLLDQLICLTAAQCPGTAEEAVDRAIDIFGVCQRKIQSGEVNRRMQEALKPPERLSE